MQGVKLLIFFNTQTYCGCFLDLNAVPTKVEKVFWTETRFQQKLKKYFGLKHGSNKS
jgi:predicted NAD-dependent protein-ADP-ribosyltransferase YbiA (DUF1768 family)